MSVMAKTIMVLRLLWLGAFAPVALADWENPRATPVPHEEELKGIWAFDLWSTLREDFTAKPLPEIAHILCADHPLVKGLAPRFHWRTLEMEKGEYNWASIDRVLEIAEEYNKPIVLRVIGGPARRYNPDWLWERVPTFAEYISAWQEPCRIPRLGDPVFQKEWNGFLRKLAERYGTHPRIQRICISCGIGQEMHYIPSPETLPPDQMNIVCSDKERCQKDLLRSWHETMLVYKEGFPGKCAVLALSEPIRGMDGVSGIDLAEKIVDDGIRIFGRKLCLQQDGLNKKNLTAQETRDKKDKKSWHSIMLAHSKTVVLGFQTMLPSDFDSVFPVGAGTPPERFYIEGAEEMKRTLEIGLSYPIEYMEIWTSTLLDPQNRSMLDSIYRDLESR